MNILYIGPYRQTDGWGHAARDYIKALLTQNINLAIRPIYMSPRDSFLQNDDLDEDFLECEQRDANDSNHIIEHVLPNLYRKYRRPTHLICKLESAGLVNTPWGQMFTVPDSVLLTSAQEVEESLSCGVKNAFKIGEPVDVEKFNSPYQRIKFIPERSFNFYFIGEIIERKNLEALLIAFHTEFHTEENVNLVLKLTKPGVPEHLLSQEANSYIYDIKKNMRIYSDVSMYKKEILITNYIPEEEMWALHRSCDCFVMPSKGEALCRPLVDSIGFGNTPIITRGTSMEDVVSEKTGYIADSRPEPILTRQSYIPNMYTSRESWHSIDIFSLRKKMREAYDNREKEIRKEKIENGIDMVKNVFSHETIGKNIIKALNEYSDKVNIT